MCEIRIGKPRLEWIENGYVRISADITQPNGVVDVLWFQTDESNADFLVHERLDAFLVGLIPFIARNGGKVICEAPVSGHLLHNLQHLLSPILPKFHPDLSPLQIKAAVDDTNFRLGGKNGIGTGCSCGVDSLATIATYSQNSVPQSLRINTLAFFDVGSHGNYASINDEQKKKSNSLAEKRSLHIESFARHVNMPIIRMTSNISSYHAGFSHVAIHTFRSMSAVLSLQKFFSVYHYASGYPITEFKISSDGVAYADEYILRCLSTESTQLYSSLAAINRQERTAIVADYLPARKYLNVCVRNIDNCGFCFKCARTMFQLDIIGRLDQFEEVFNVKEYRRNYSKILKLLSKDTHFHNEFLTTATVSPHFPFSVPRFKLALLIGSIENKLICLRKQMFRKNAP